MSMLADLTYSLRFVLISDKRFTLLSDAKYLKFKEIKMIDSKYWLCNYFDGFDSNGNT